MSAYTRVYRTPGGEHTTHSATYVKAWETLGERVLRLLPDHRLISFDPDLIFAGPDERIPWLRLSVDHAEMLASAYEELQAQHHAALVALGKVPA